MQYWRQVRTTFVLKFSSFLKRRHFDCRSLFGEYILLKREFLSAVGDLLQLNFFFLNSLCIREKCINIP